MGYSQRPDQKGAGVTTRAVVLGLILVPLNVYWVIAAELRWYVVLTLNPLFVTPIFYLFMLVCLNSLIRRIKPRLVFKPGELVTLYVMLVMTCTIATHDFIINLMTTMSWARWYATPENRWETQLFTHLPRWLFVWDKDLLEGYFAGNGTLYNAATLKMWIVPLGFWTIFIFAVCWMMICMSVMVRKAWTEETKLSFPIIRLPLALAQDSTPDSILRSQALWWGFSIAAVISLINGLHVWFPNLPYWQVRARYIEFPYPPWTAAAPMWIAWYPFAIGLAYLVPVDVSFSCWFFYLFFKIQAVAGYRMGYGGIPDFPFVHEQGIGAWLAFGVSLIFMYRRYFVRIVRAAFDNNDTSCSSEPMSYRTALIGLLGGMIVFCVFWYQAGMSLLWVVVVLFTYLLISLSITRVRAEAGGQHNVWDLEPMNLMRLFDSHSLGPANLAAGAVSHWYWRLNRSSPMPSQFEAFKLAQECGLNLRSLVAPMMSALALAGVFGMWSCLHIFYSAGAVAKCQGYAVWTGMETFTWLDNALGTGFHAEASRWIAVCTASVFTLLLAWLRTRLLWFPFHPLGYCMGSELRWLWFPFFIAWLIKLPMLKFGGLRIYRKSLPFFLGLVLGDYVAGAVWSLIGIAFGVPVNQVFH